MIPAYYRGWMAGKEAQQPARHKEEPSPVCPGQAHRVPVARAQDAIETTSDGAQRRAGTTRPRCVRGPRGVSPEDDLPKFPRAWRHYWRPLATWWPPSHAARPPGAVGLPVGRGMTAARRTRKSRSALPATSVQAKYPPYQFRLDRDQDADRADLGVLRACELVGSGGLSAYRVRPPC